jgi:hypothetical protein
MDAGDLLLLTPAIVMPNSARSRSTIGLQASPESCSWQIKELAENMGFEVLHGIVDCLWVKGEPISRFKEAAERETGILTEVDSTIGSLSCQWPTAREPTTATSAGWIRAR